ncbi:hypothetical protein [Cellvibrio sp.]|uniref:hypothetical protein n=1 Tax=Cellvibrio sp. TaxID=1965322 RepID=UPI0039647D98
MNDIFRHAKLLPLLLAMASLLLLVFMLGRHMNGIWMNTNVSNVFVDDTTYVMHEALIHSNDSNPVVVFIGGSVTREATIIDGDFSAFYMERFGVNQKFLNLGSSNQTLAESAALISSLKLKPGSIVFIQFSYKKLGYGEAEYNKELFRPNMPLLDYSAVRQELSYYDKVLHIFTPKILLGRNFWHYFEAKRGCSHLQLVSMESTCYESRDVVRSYYKEENRMTSVKKDEYVNNIKNLTFKEYRKNREFSEKILSNTIRMILGSGATPVLIEYPIDEREKELYSLAKNDPEYKEIFERLSKNAEHFDLVSNQIFVSNDFYDSQHMLKSGKQKSTELIAVFTNNLIEKKEKNNDHERRNH